MRQLLVINYINLNNDTDKFYLKMRKTGRIKHMKQILLLKDEEHGGIFSKKPEFTIQNACCLTGGIWIPGKIKSYITNFQIKAAAVI